MARDTINITDISTVQANPSRFVLQVPNNVNWAELILIPPETGWYPADANTPIITVSVETNIPSGWTSRWAPQQWWVCRNPINQSTPRVWFSIEGYGHQLRIVAWANKPVRAGFFLDH